MEFLSLVNSEEKELLLKYPAYISLLAANADGEMNEIEKKAAIKFTHIKTYSCVPLLSEFYKEVDKHFEHVIEQLDRQLPKGKAERYKSINHELLKIEKILTKLGHDYKNALHKSMQSYTKHVSMAHRNILEYFIFPVPLNGITD